MGKSDKLLTAFKAFDTANAKDPNKEFIEGREYPKELLYAKRMTHILNTFEHKVSEALQLAVRCQHICRWEIPRETYEMNRAGYLKWRQELQSFHMEKASTILQSVGYNQKTIERVCFLMLKKQLKKDIETQILEDVICLVFLKYYFDPFLLKHDEDKIITILRKTWKKMSDKGQRVALLLPYSEKGLDLVHRALYN
ncbi:DUF4202 domain-containing protein [Allomuricauda sp. NBRC 101325]|uniref:DUF4202 domain-containing protein n=1 Tax=Allomuricauda sp. NBRC 101325 TaxID=1113758 RepID=UPI002555D1BC|nr:DUF4202 domain-containing protein [Muricauda sp. NBRC 101325]